MNTQEEIGKAKTRGELIALLEEVVPFLELMWAPNWLDKNAGCDPFGAKDLAHRIEDALMREAANKPTLKPGAQVWVRAEVVSHYSDEDVCVKPTKDRPIKSETDGILAAARMRVHPDDIRVDTPIPHNPLTQDKE